jgi:hypothetical protein
MAQADGMNRDHPGFYAGEKCGPEHAQQNDSYFGNDHRL